MADFGSPVAQNVQAPSLQSLSTLMGLRGQQLTQQQQQQNLEKGAAETQMTQQNAQQRSALAGVDWSKYSDGDGMISTDKMLDDPSLRKAAGDQYLDVLQKAAAARNAQLTAKTGLAGLNGALREQWNSQLGALRTDPDIVNDTPVGRQKVDAAADAFARSGGPDAARIASFYRAQIDHVPQGQLDRALSTAQLQGASAERQASMQSPTYVNTGTSLQQTNLQAPGGDLAGGPSAPSTAIPLGISPGQADTIETDAQGNRYVVSRSPSGAIVNTRAVPGTQGTGGKGAGPVNLPPNETAETRAQLQQQRTDAQTSATQAPTMHNLNRSIIAEADKNFNTGTLGQLTQKMSSATGFAIGGDSSTDYNVMGKMLERSALTAAQGMGPHTNAGLEAQVKANGSTDYTPQAIRKIAALNDAMTAGQAMYQSGLEKAIASSPNGVFAKRQFDQQWGGTADVNALRLKNAVDNGDQKEIAAVTQEAGGAGSAGAKALHAKLTKLLQLAGQ